MPPRVFPFLRRGQECSCLDRYSRGGVFYQFQYTGYIIGMIDKNTQVYDVATPGKSEIIPDIPIFIDFE